MIKLEINGGVDLQCNTWLFPAGEVGVQLPVISATESVKLIVDYPTSDEVLQMFNIFNALYNMHIPKANVELVIRYFPYARQDRVCKNGESFALDVFCQLLKQIGHFGKLTTWDLHSKISDTLLNCCDFKVNHVEQHEIAKSLPMFNFLIAPDKGAVEKVKKHKQVTSLRADAIFFEKQRTESGIIYPPATSGLYEGTACVVDDICDGGETFLQLGRMLNKTQPNLELSLYVTHGIFSNEKKFEELLKIYDTIYVGTVMNRSRNSNVKELL